MSNEETARRLLALVRTLEDLMGDVEAALGVEPEEAGDAEPRLALVPEPGDDEACAGFLDEHPELAPEPLTFTDDELLDAMDRASANWNERCRERSPWCVGEDVSAVSVARVLVLDLRPSPTNGDCGRVVAGLRRLAQAGRVTYLRYSGREGGCWVKAGRERYVSESTKNSTRPGVLPNLTTGDVFEALKTALRTRKAAAVPFQAVHEAVLPDSRKRSDRTNARIRYLLVELRKAGRVQSMRCDHGGARLWTCPDELLGDQTA
jgi:hypothetical protein